MYVCVCDSERERTSKTTDFEIPFILQQNKGWSIQCCVIMYMYASSIFLSRVHITFSLSTTTCGLTVQDLLVAEMKNSWWRRRKVQTLQHCSITVLDSSAPYTYYNNMHMQKSNFPSLKMFFWRKKRHNPLPPEAKFWPPPTPKTDISVPDSNICILPLPSNFLFTVTDTDFYHRWLRRYSVTTPLTEQDMWTDFPENRKQQYWC